MPLPGGYWFCPPRMAATAASRISSGPSVSGKPCPRLMAPVATASADISAKIVEPKPRARDARCGESRVMDGGAAGPGSPLSVGERGLGHALAEDDLAGALAVDV